jgi:hypothetical protein
LGSSSVWVRADEKTLSDERTYMADLVDDAHPWRHDAAKVAQAILDIFNQKVGQVG